MSLDKIIILTLQVSVFLTAFSIGLMANFGEAVSLFRRPGLLLRSLAVMFLLMPAFAVMIVRVFEFNRAVEIALVALSLSPMPPLLPKKLVQAGGSHSYTVGLLVTASLLSIGMIPLTLELLNRFYALSLHVPGMTLIKIVLITVFAPLVSGMIVRALAPRWVGKVVNPFSKFAVLALILAVLPVLFLSGPVMWSLVGNGTIMIFACFTLLGLGAGHLLGGPSRGQRVVLSLSAASRHPGIALAIAAVNYPEQKRSVLAAILLYLIVNAITTLPYLLRKPKAAEVLGS